MNQVADKVTLRRVIFAASLGICVITVVVSALFIHETKDHKIDAGV